MENDTIKISPDKRPLSVTIANAEDEKFSGWECHLFGMGRAGIVVRPLEGRVPNRFWRIMQYLIIGNKWINIPRK